MTEQQQRRALAVTQRGRRLLGFVPEAATAEMAKHGFLRQPRQGDQEVVLSTTCYFLGEHATPHMDIVLNHVGGGGYTDELNAMVLRCVRDTDSAFYQHSHQAPQSARGTRSPRP